MPLPGADGIEIKSWECAKKKTPTPIHSCAVPCNGNNSTAWRRRGDAWPQENSGVLLGTMEVVHCIIRPGEPAFKEVRAPKVQSAPTTIVNSLKHRMHGVMWSNFPLQTTEEISRSSLGLVTMGSQRRGVAELPGHGSRRY